MCCPHPPPSLTLALLRYVLLLYPKLVLLLLCKSLLCVVSMGEVLFLNNRIYLCSLHLHAATSSPWSLTQVAPIELSQV